MSIRFTNILKNLMKQEQTIKQRSANSTYTQGRVSCIADTFVQAESSVPRINFSAKKPALRVGANRYAQCQYD